MSTVEITPAKAAEYLQKAETNPRFKNRAVSQRKVDQYARDMREENWDADASTIHLDQDGYLINGFHRMWACVISETPFFTHVIKVADADRTIPKLDIGRSRGAHDILAIYGHSNSVLLSAVIRMHLRHQHGKGPFDSTYVVTPEDILSFVEEHPSLIENVTAVFGWGTKPRLVSSSRWGFLVITAKHKTRAQEFCYQVIHGYDRAGNGINQTNVVTALRNKLIDNRSNDRNRLSQIQETYIICMAYLDWKKGTTRRRIQLPKLTWKGETRKAEDVYKIPKRL